MKLLSWVWQKWFGRFRDLPRTDRILEIAFWLFFVSVSILAYCTVHHYGITWDEEIHHWYGEQVVSYFTSGFKNREAINHPDMRLYGPIFDGTAVLAVRLLGFDLFETRHVINVTVGLWGILGIWYFGRFISGRAVGLAAAIILCLIPSYYGHMFNNPKDLPFAVGYIWSLYFIARIFATMPRVPINIIIKAGVAMGLTLGVRIGALLLLFYLFLAILIKFIGAIVSERPSIKRLAVMTFQYAKAPFSVFVIAYLLMVAFWPWALENPLTIPIRALTEMSHFPWRGNVLFNGKLVPGLSVPLSYAPVYFFVKVPIAVWICILLFIVGMVLTAAKWKWPAGLRIHRSSLVLLVFAQVFPLVYVIAKHTTLYDEIRHLMFLLPPLAVFAGLGLVYFFSLLKGGRVWKVVASLILAAYMAMHVATLVRIHPYQYAYYNEVIKGLPGAHNRFETDYWATSFRELVAQLKEKLNSFDARIGQNRTYSVEICGPVQPAAHFFNSRLRLAQHKERPDFFIAMMRFGCPEQYPYISPYLSVFREGVPLSIVKAVIDYPN